MIKIIFVLFFITINSISFAQSGRDEMDRQVREMMKARDEMLQSLLNDNAFENFDKRFEDLIKKFEKSGFGQGFNMEGPVIGEYDWRETGTHKIFILKVKQIKDRPLDIKIEKGQIRLKGDVESVDENINKKSKRVSKVHFERTFSIPDDVDQGNPEFENKEGELRILFKKSVAKKGSVINPSKKSQERPPQDEKLPVGPSPDDIKI